MLPLNYSKCYYSLFVSMFTSSWGISVVILYSICWMDFYTWTSGIYIRLSNNLQKELATGCPVPINYNFNCLILFTFLPWFISQAMTYSEISACVNKREEGWSTLLVEITFFMGAALESLVDKGVRVPTTIRWQQQTPLKYLFCALYMLSKT